MGPHPIRAECSSSGSALLTAWNSHATDAFLRPSAAELARMTATVAADPMNLSSIRRVTIKSFRSFPTASFDLDNPLFVVGRNGSGKSNLVDVFSFAAEAMASPLQAVFDRRGGIQAVRNRSSVKSAPLNIGMAFEFGPFNGIEGGRFAFEVRARTTYGSSSGARARRASACRRMRAGRR